MNSILTIKAHKRPYYLKEVLNSLENCIGIENQKILISLDFNLETRKESRDIVDSFKFRSNIDLRVHIHKLGCAGNMRYCLEESFENNNNDFMIHLEDDTPVAKDFLLFMNWAYEYIKNNENIFTICPFTRNCSGGGDESHQINKTILKPGFDCGGGYGITKTQWEYIKSLGGMFGIVGPAATEAPPEDWKRLQKITEDGSWAWPFRRYFCREKLNLFPEINRTNNIGLKEGRFNPSEDFHRTNIYVENWAGNDRYINIDFNNITYLEPNVDDSKQSNNLPH